MPAARHSTRVDRSTLAVVAFLVFAFLLGGGSRYDIYSLPLLRLGAVIAIGYGMYHFARTDWKRWRLILLPFALFTGWVLLQLVPLPYTVWTLLPGRDVLAQAGDLLGAEHVWRPISVAPWRTTNALLALTIPWAIVLLAIRTDLSATMYPTLALIGLGIASSLLGILQILGPEGSPLYLYRITNDGSAVGLFSNRNHNAAFLACTLPLVAYATGRWVTSTAAATTRGGTQSASVASKLVIMGAAATVVVIGIFATGSRAGFLAAGLATACSFLILRGQLSDSANNVNGLRRNFTTYAGGAALLIVGIGLVLFFGESEAINRLKEIDQAEELRLKIWGPISNLIPMFGWTGAGFGTLPDVYLIVEPDELLSPQLVNHAHNDWLELVVEGGIPAVLAALLAIVTYIRVGLMLMAGKADKFTDRSGALAYGGVILILAMFSIGDYPVRTPSLSALLLLAAVTFVAGARRPEGAGQ